MHQLTYISTARSVDNATLEAILAASRRNNGRDGITGLLLFNGKRFLQALEGPTALVEATYARIATDPRHRAPVILASKHVEARQFGKWAMAFEQGAVPTQGRSLVETVDELVSGVQDADVRALFSSYVRLQSAA